MTKMTEHFLPDYHHWGDITGRIETGLRTFEVPFKRVPKIHRWGDEKPPYNVFGCTWHHCNHQGALTKEKFDKDLEGAIGDFVNGLRAEGKFLAYPITHHPPTTFGMAYHDWVGAAYPFDIRVVIALDENIPVGEDEVDAGLKFHITTLLKSEHYDEWARKQS